MDGKTVSVNPVSTPMGAGPSGPETTAFGLGSSALDWQETVAADTSAYHSIWSAHQERPYMIPQGTLIVRIRDAVNYRLHRLKNIKPMPTNWEQDQFIDPRKKIRVNSASNRLMGLFQFRCSPPYTSTVIRLLR